VYPPDSVPPQVVAGRSVRSWLPPPWAPGRPRGPWSPPGIAMIRASWRGREARRPVSAGAGSQVGQYVEFILVL